MTTANSIQPSYQQCEDYAAEGRFGLVSKATAQKCQELFPDEFVAKSCGKRKVQFWYVGHTWGRWWQDWSSIWSSPSKSDNASSEAQNPA